MLTVLSKDRVSGALRGLIRKRGFARRGELVLPLLSLSSAARVAAFAQHLYRTFQCFAMRATVVRFFLSGIQLHVGLAHFFESLMRFSLDKSRLAGQDYLKLLDAEKRNDDRKPQAACS